MIFSQLAFIVENTVPGSVAYVRANCRIKFTVDFLGVDITLILSPTDGISVEES